MLCLAELIDSNTTIGIWRIWEGIRGLTGVYEKQSGARDSSCFQETKHPRQVHRKPCSPLLLSTQSLEGVVWISETQRKYSWLFPHIHITTGIILGTQLHTHNKSEIMREESATQTQPFQTPRSGCTTSAAAQDWKIRIQQWTAGSRTVCWWEISSLLGAWRWQAVSYHTDSTSPVS